MTAYTREQIHQALEAVVCRTPGTDKADALAEALGLAVEEPAIEPGWYLHRDGSPVYIYDVNERRPEEVRLYVTDSEWVRRERGNLAPAKVVPA